MLVSIYSAAGPGDDGAMAGLGWLELTSDGGAEALGTAVNGAQLPHRDYLKLHLNTIPLHRALLRSVECRLISRYRFERPMLDVGAGDGHFASLLFPDGVDVGIDPSAEALREAASRGVYRELMAASACQLPFADESFASVISNCVLEHIPSLESALDEIARVLRPGGLFVTTVPSPNYERLLLGATVLRAAGMRPLAHSYGRWMTRISYHYHYYTPEEWERRLGARGLTLRHWQYYFSPGAHRAFDLSHYISAPSLLVRKLTGRWILFPNKPVALRRRLLARFYEKDVEGEGAYMLLVCTKGRGEIPSNDVEKEVG